MKKSGLLLFLLYLIPLVLLVLFTWRLFSSGYSEFTAYLASSLQKPEWEKFIQVRFTASSFAIARGAIIVISILYLAAGLLLIYKGSGFLMKWNAMLQAVRIKTGKKITEFNSMPSYARWLFLLLLVFVFIKAGWYIINWPLQYDEAWTYNYYIGNSFWQSFLLPHNNHILFTTVAWVFQWLPLDPQISMRIPNLFAGLGLVILFFFFIKRYLSLNAALFSTFWLATCSPVVFYMLYARGYMFVLLFTLIALWVQIILIEDNRRKFFRFALVPAIVLGYWSNPVFMYSHAAIGLTMIFCYLIQKNRKALWQNISVHFLAVFFVIILYLPTLLSSHIHDLVNVGVKHSFDLSILWKPFYNNSWFIFWGLKKDFIILAGIVFLFFLTYFFRKQQEPLKWFVWSGILVLPGFSVLQSLPLAGHITIFFSISVAIMLAFIFLTVETKIEVNKILLIVLVSGIAILNSLGAHRHHWFKWSMEYDKSAKKIAGIMISKNIRSCYLVVNYYKPQLEYYYKIKSEKLWVSLPEPVSHDYREFNPKEQEIVITRNNKPSGLDLSDYREFYKDEIITAYIRKDLQTD